MNLPNIGTLKATGGMENLRGLALAAPVGAILASLAILALIVWPKYTEIQQLKADNLELATRAQGLEEKVQVLATLDSRNLEKQLAAAEALMPSEKEVFVLIRQIENASASTGLLLNKVEVVPGTINDAGGDTQPGAGGAVAAPPVGSTSIAPKIQVRISVTTTYGSLLQFLSALYSGARTVTVDDITVSTSSGESQVRAAITVEAFWKPLPVDLGSIEKPVVKLSDKETQILNAVAEKGLSSQPTVPTVPLGRSDLFAPF